MAKTDNDPIKALLTQKTTMTRPNLSPIDYINKTAAELDSLLSATYGTYTLEKASPSVYQHLLSNVETTNLDLCLGNSNTRTQTKAAQGKALIDQMLQGANQPDTINIFTDGSSLGNLGPTGAGAIIKFNTIQPPTAELSMPVDPHSNNVHGEIAAVEMGLSHVKGSLNPTTNKINVFCDCKAAIQVITSPNPPTCYYQLIQQTRDLIQEIGLTHNNLRINLIWIPGHANIELNEQADQLAKQGARQAALMQQHIHAVTLATGS